MISGRVIHIQNNFRSKFKRATILFERQERLFSSLDVDIIFLVSSRRERDFRCLKLKCRNGQLIKTRNFVQNEQKSSQIGDC